MIIIVSENPDPMSERRKDVNIEVRVMIKGATDDEGDHIGTELRKAIKRLRPHQKIRAFQIDGDVNCGK